ncbi:MAG: hypothetical protein JWO89_465 [Verrucomicrobiaceae bacterium]|nr:hypothetical protein [Verrucomicrobiaceae bacterium]
MTATLDIPDDLYRKIEAKAAQTGARLHEVAVNLLEGWVNTSASEVDQPGASVQWLNEWMRLGTETCKGLADSPTARDILNEGRQRVQ